MNNTKKISKLLSLLLAFCLTLCALAGCGEKSEDSNESASASKSNGGFDKSKYSSYMDSKYLDTLAKVEVKDKMQVKMTVKEYGTIILELYPEIAPLTVRNFVNLVNDGFYDGLTFHRVIKGFMIQGGDPNGDGTGDSKNTIFGEFSENGFENGLKHEAGVISMGRSNDSNSASCQFFICDVDSSDSLDGNYAGFGKVIEGLDVVQKIASCDTIYVCPLDGNKVADSTTQCPSCGYTMTKLAEAYGYTLEQFDYYKYSPKNQVVIEKVEVVK